jgi:hypothetical protein
VISATASIIGGFIAALVTPDPGPPSYRLLWKGSPGRGYTDYVSAGRFADFGAAVKCKDSHVDGIRRHLEAGGAYEDKRDAAVEIQVSVGQKWRTISRTRIEPPR